MKTLTLLSFGLALLAAPAFATVRYQPEGAERPLSEIVNDMVVKEKATTFVFDHGVVYLELGEQSQGNQRFAKANDVEILAKEIENQRVVTKIKAGARTWDKSWNKLAVKMASGEEYEIYNFVTELRDYAKDSLDRDYANDKDELFRTVISLYGYDYEPMSLTGDLATYYHSSAGYGGGAHDWAWSGFKGSEWVGGENTSLLDYVDNQSLLEALKADKFLRGMADSAEMGKEFRKATQLTELDRLLGATGGGDRAVMWSMRAGQQFQKFALWDYDVKTGEVLVRIGLEYNSEVNRGQFEQLGLRVKAKPEFAATLAALKKNGEGLFMKDVAKGKRP